MNDVAAQLEESDVLVLPSLLSEGMPMVVLEAMAAGVPVVGTRVDGIRDLIEHEKTGLLATPGDADSLADELARLIRGDVEWSQLRRQAADLQRSRFSDQSMVRSVAGVYREVLADTSGEGRIELFDLPLDNLRMRSAVETIIRRATEQDDAPPMQVSFVNAGCVNVALCDAEYRKAVQGSDLVLIDGVGMQLAGHLAGKPVLDNVNGTDLFPKLCRSLAEAASSLFLLSARPDVPDGVAGWIHENVPALRVAGVQHGYFAPDELPAVLGRIRESGADVLLVAMGAPRQELWIREHLAETGVKVAIGVGGLFDFYSDRIPRAPLWMRRSGLEWAYRFLKEPRRLWRRYLVGNGLFLWRAWQFSRRRTASRGELDASRRESAAAENHLSRSRSMQLD